MKLIYVDNNKDIISNSTSFVLACPKCGSINQLCEIYEEYTKYDIDVDKFGNINYGSSDTFSSTYDHTYCMGCDIELRYDTTKYIIGINKQNKCIYITNKFKEMISNNNVLKNIINNIKNIK